MNAHTTLEHFSDLFNGRDVGELREFRRLVEHSPDSSVALYAANREILHQTWADVDLDEAIRSAEQLLSSEDPPLTQETSARVRAECSTLLVTKFKRTVVKEDLVYAIFLMQKAVQATPENSPDYSIRIHALVGMGDRLKYMITAGIAISRSAGQVPMTAQQKEWFHTLPERFLRSHTAAENRKVLDLLREQYALQLERWKSTRSQGDLDQAVGIAEAIVEATPRAAPFRPYALLIYVDALSLSQIDMTLGLDKLNHGVDLLNSALKGVHDPFWRAQGLEELSGFLIRRYTLTGQTNDLWGSVSSAEQAINRPLVDPESHPGRVHNLANKLLVQYRFTGCLEVLKRALSVARESVALISRISRPEREAGFKVTLAGMLATMHLRTGDTTYLEEGLQICEGVRPIADMFDNRLESGEFWNCLALLLRQRYTRHQVKDDIDQAVTAANNAVAAFSPPHPRRTLMLSNLSYLLLDQCILNGPTSADWERIIKLARDGVAGTPDSGTDKALQINILIYPLIHRKQDGDLDEALKWAHKTVELAPRGSPAYTSYRNNLANILRLKAESLPVERAANEWAKAIDLLQSVLVDTRSDDPARGHRLFHLGTMMEQKSKIFRAERQEDDAARDRASAVDAYEECSKNRNLTPSFRMKAAVLAADILLNDDDLGRADGLLQEALRLLREVSPRSLAQRDQQNMIRQFVGLATSATAVALQIGRPPEEALTTLEEGRGVIIGMLFEVRSDAAELRSKHPIEAAEFERLRDVLDQPVARHGLEGFESVGPSFQLTHRAEVAKEFDEVLGKIRRLPSFERFLLPPLADELKTAASRGHVVMVNVSTFRSDAIIVRADRPVDILELPNLALRDVETWVGRLRSRSSATENDMIELLEWLWDVLAKPVLRKLGIGLGERTAATATRVWWIPTGPLCALPIHAAGKYRDVSKPQALLDYIVSSYSPSIRTMLFARQNKLHVGTQGQPPPDHKPLLVAMGNTPGCNPLRFAPNEVEVVCQELSASPTHGDPHILREPNRRAILDQLGGASIFHFAGHGVSNPNNPLQSALIASDGHGDALTVEDLIKVKDHRTPPFLAYLSACSTSSNDAQGLLDEGLHLVGACQLVGFQHVVGSLWEVPDEHCVQMARVVYRTIVEEGMSDHSVAIGLQRGLKLLRDGRDGERPPASGLEETRNIVFASSTNQHGTWRGGDPRIWAAYIHMGI